MSLRKAIIDLSSHRHPPGSASLDRTAVLCALKRDTYVGLVFCASYDYFDQ